MRSRPTHDMAYSPGGSGAKSSLAPPPSTGTKGYTQPVENATMRARRNTSATIAGTCTFIAQVSGRAPPAPNLRPAMNMTFANCGSRSAAPRSRRSQAIVSMPRRSNASRNPGSLNRATATTRFSGAARRAIQASVGPILPPAPSTRMSPSSRARSATSASLGRASNSSSAAPSATRRGSAASFRMTASALTALHQEHALAAGLLVEEPIGFLGLIEPPAVSEQIVDLDVAVGDELRALRLPHLRERPRTDDGELLAQHVWAHVDRHISALADETNGAPGARATNRSDAALRRAGCVERGVSAAPVRHVLDGADRIVAVRIDQHVGAEFLGAR